ncbi:MAG TPA: hypothetical protein DIS66_02240, partial [Candidatus Omnitrophica bacterium]|nr:hypothetical protein [Candidatus Omnitrophota bacterium]
WLNDQSTGSGANTKDNNLMVNSLAGVSGGVVQAAKLGNTFASSYYDTKHALTDRNGGRFALDANVIYNGSDYFWSKDATPPAGTSNRHLVEMGVIDLCSSGNCGTDGTRFINQIDVDFWAHDGRGQYNFKVQVSDDGEKWDTVFDGSDTNVIYNDIEKVTFTGRDVRYIKIFASRNTSNTGAHIEGVHARFNAALANQTIVKNPPRTTDINFATLQSGAKFFGYQSATNSGNYAATVSPQSILDGIDSTSSYGYRTNYESWLTDSMVEIGTLDLGTQRMLNEVSLTFYDHAAYRFANYRIDVSDDGITWETVFDATGLNTTFQGQQTVNFSERSVRYVKVFLGSSTANAHGHIQEIRAQLSSNINYASAAMGSSVKYMGDWTVSGNAAVAKTNGSIVYELDFGTVAGGTRTISYNVQNFQSEGILNSNFRILFEVETAPGVWKSLGYDTVLVSSAAKVGSVTIPADITPGNHRVRMTWTNNQSLDSQDNNLQINSLNVVRNGVSLAAKLGKDFVSAGGTNLYSMASGCGDKTTCSVQDTETWDDVYTTSRFLINGANSGGTYNSFSTLLPTSGKTLHEIGTIDLGVVRSVNEVMVHFWDDGRVYSNLKIEVSENGTDWTSVVDGTNTETVYSGPTAITFANQNVRYVRVYSSVSTSNYIHIEEIQIRNRPVPPVVTAPAARIENVNFGLSLLGSKFVPAAWLPASSSGFVWLTDGETSDASRAKGDYAKIPLWGDERMLELGVLDLGGKRLINEVNLQFGDWQNWFYGNYRVDVSVDGLSWETVFDGSGDLIHYQARQAINFSEREVQYIKIYSSGSTNNGWLYIEEIGAQLNSNINYAGATMGSSVLRTVENTVTVTSAGTTSEYWNGWRAVGTSGVNFFNTSEGGGAVVYNQVDFGADSVNGRSLELNVQNHFRLNHLPVANSKFIIKVEYEKSPGIWEYLDTVQVDANNANTTAKT